MYQILRHCTGAASYSEGYLVVLPADGGAALVRVPSVQGGREGTPRVVLLPPFERVGEGATFDFGAVSPNGGKVALAYTCSSLHIYNILSCYEDYELRSVRLQAMKSRVMRCDCAKRDQSCSIAFQRNLCLLTPRMFTHTTQAAPTQHTDLKDSDTLLGRCFLAVTSAAPPTPTN